MIVLVRPSLSIDKDCVVGRLFFEKEENDGNWEPPAFGFACVADWDLGLFSADSHVEAGLHSLRVRTLALLFAPSGLRPRPVTEERRVAMEHRDFERELKKAIGIRKQTSLVGPFEIALTR